MTPGLRFLFPDLRMYLAAVSTDFSMLFIELGIVVLGLVVLGRLANRFGFSSIPLYLLAGLAFGNGGILPLQFSEGFVSLGAEVGVILLLFMLGLEYTADELQEGLTTGWKGGLVDFAMNFSPGYIAGWMLGFSSLASVLLGGVTYVSSSGIAAKLFAESPRKRLRTGPVLTLLVLEDLAMAGYLPIVSVLLAGTSAMDALGAIGVAIAASGVVLFVALRFGRRISRAIFHQSDEVILLTTLGIVLIVAGVSQRLNISAAVGAFLVGVAMSGPVVKRATRIFTPLRDLFASSFFLFFGLQIDPGALVPVLPFALALALLTGLTKYWTGWKVSLWAGLHEQEARQAGITLLARGEFSIVIAGLGAGASSVDSRLQPLSAAYVLILAVAGPIIFHAFARRRPIEAS